MGIVEEIEEAIERNPVINRVLVSELERDLILIEYNSMWVVGLGPRPTHDGPEGRIDRMVWDALHRNPIPEIKIKGRPVEIFNAANV